MDEADYLKEINDLNKWLDERDNELRDLQEEFRELKREYEICENELEYIKSERDALQDDYKSLEEDYSAEFEKRVVVVKVLDGEEYCVGPFLDKQTALDRMDDAVVLREIISLETFNSMTALIRQRKDF